MNHKRAATIETLLQKAMPAWKARTINNARIARALRIFGRDVESVGKASKGSTTLGMTSQGLSYIPKRLDMGALPKGGTPEQRKALHKLNRILVYAHEHAERSRDLLPWDLQPRRFKTHYGLGPILTEHNILTQLKPALSEKSKVLRYLRAHKPNELAEIERMIPGFRYGSSPRLSRHALKRLDQLYERHLQQRADDKWLLPGMM